MDMHEGELSPRPKIKPEARTNVKVSATKIGSNAEKKARDAPFPWWTDKNDTQPPVPAY